MEREQWKRFRVQNEGRGVVPRSRCRKEIFVVGSGGGQVVSVLAFYSDDPSSKAAEVYIFYSVNCLKRTEINKTRLGMAHSKKLE